MTNLFTKAKRQNKSQKTMGKMNGWKKSTDASGEINNINYKHDTHLSFHDTFNRV